MRGTFLDCCAFAASDVAVAAAAKSAMKSRRLISAPELSKMIARCSVARLELVWDSLNTVDMPAWTLVVEPH